MRAVDVRFSAMDYTELLIIVCSVPLDYANTSLGVANLAVARYRATNTTHRLGTIFTNPGGPGGRQFHSSLFFMCSSNSSPVD